MTLLEQILSQSTFFGIFIAILLWMSARIIDILLEKVLDRQVFGAIYGRVIKRVKIFQTRYDPISSTFHFTYTLSESPSFDTTARRIQRALNKCESLSEDKINFGDVHTDANEESLHVKAEYLNKDSYEIDIGLNPNVEEIRSDSVEKSTQASVDTIVFAIDFEFAFRDLDRSLMNLGAFVRLLEKAFGKEFAGHSSPGQFVIQPLETDLTLDEWIEREQFDVSVLLESKDQKTSVEFFGDHAVVNSPYLEIDSDTTQYIRATLLNYYL